MRIAALIALLEKLRSEIAEIDALEAPTDDQLTRMETALGEFDTNKAELDTLTARSARVEAVRSAVVAAPANSERTFVPSTSRTKDPFDFDADKFRAGQIPMSELSSRALDAVELSDRMEDDSKEHVTRLIQGKTDIRRHTITKKARGELVAHILTTGTEQYAEDFERYIEDPQGYAGRAAFSLTSANGGYLVPFNLDPTIILTNSGSANPFRQLATTKTTATNNWNGVTSAGVNAGWLAEGVEDTDHTPVVGNLVITPQKASAWLFGSYEVQEDSDIAQSLPMLLADAKDRLEEAAFATGTGGTQPWGIVPRATTVASATAATFAAADVYALQAALPARFRGPNARLAWLANIAIMQRARQFDTAGGSAFWANLGMKLPEELLGAPIFESTSIVGTITTASKNLVLADMSQYIIVDKIGMSVLYEPMVKGTANGRPTGQSGWFAFWRVGGDLSTAAAARVLLEG